MIATAVARKSLRHSAFRAMGPVTVTRTSDPRPSRFAGRGSYVCLSIVGHEGVSFAYEAEHEGVVAELSALPIHQSVLVQALGRDAAATVARLDQPAPMAAVVAPDVARAADMAVEMVAALRDRIGREPTPAEAVAYVMLVAAKF